MGQSTSSRCTGNAITDTANIGILNPFRYRSYYFDVETGLYYLQTRYADPETINGLNLYAYCGNNPVMNTDPAGHGWLDWLVAGLVIIGSAVAAVATAGTSLLMTGALAGIAIGGTVSVVDQVATTGDVDMNRFATDVVSSAISGALAATGLGAGMQILGNLAIGAGSALLYSGLSGEPITVESGISSLASGLMGGIFGGAGAKYISLGSNLMKDIVNKSFAQGKILPALLRSNLAIQTYNLIKKIIGIIS